MKTGAHPYHQLFTVGIELVKAAKPFVLSVLPHLDSQWKRNLKHAHMEKKVREILLPVSLSPSCQQEQNYTCLWITHMERNQTHTQILSALSVSLSAHSLSFLPKNIIETNQAINQATNQIRYKDHNAMTMQVKNAPVVQQPCNHSQATKQSFQQVCLLFGIDYFS